MLYAEIKKSENKTKKEEEKLTFTFHFTNEIITVCLCKQFQPFFMYTRTLCVKLYNDRYVDHGHNSLFSVTVI